MSEALAIDPFRANEKIRLPADGREIFMVEDTLVHLMWEEGNKVSSKDKPFLTWRRVQRRLKNPGELEQFPRLKDLFGFVYNW